MESMSVTQTGAPTNNQQSEVSCGAAGFADCSALYAKSAVVLYACLASMYALLGAAGAVSGETGVLVSMLCWPLLW